MSKITTDFSTYEFAPMSWTEVDRKLWNPPKLTMMMIVNLARYILQPIRDGFGKTVITSGVRTAADHARLVSGGYKPSWKSDHYYGSAVEVSLAHRHLYGDHYTQSVGAVDIVTPNSDLKLVFAWIVQELPHDTFGQVIYETQLKDDNSEVAWIHVSNPRDLIYSPRAANLFMSKKIMIGQNGVYRELSPSERNQL